LAADSRTAASRLQLLEMAAVFQKLAEHASANRNWATDLDAQTA
jgi:hypothetical protein